MDDEMITIPVTEYESLRSCVMLHDKIPLIRDLNRLLQEKSQDVDRYKEKYEQSQSVLERTQKQLDKYLIDQETTSLSMRSVGSRSGINIRIKTPTPVSRSTKDSSNDDLIITDRAMDNPPVEHDETASLPGQPPRPRNNKDSLKSLPAHLATITSPGMSANLLKKLVQENLKLRKLVESKGKIPTYPAEAENVISELKLKLSRQEKLISELKIRLAVDGNGKNLDDSSLVIDENAELRKKVADLEKTREMVHLTQEALGNQLKQLTLEKQQKEALLNQYQQFQSSFEEENSKKIVSLEKQLSDVKNAATSQLQTVQLELARSQQRMEHAELERDVYQQNYQSLCTQIQRQQPQAQTYIPPLSMPVSSRHTTDTPYSQTPLHHNQPQSVQSVIGTRLQLSNNQSEPPLPPRMVRSCSAQPTTPPTPEPRERRTFKCPKCETIFNALQHYRDHIKLCLKTT